MPALPPSRALLSCTRGAAAVEFAIIAGVLIALLVGILDVGRAFYVKNQISFLADRAVRRVLIQPGVSSEALEQELRDAFSAGAPQDLSVSITAETAGGTDYRIITVGFPLTLFIPHLDSDGVSLSVTRRIPAG